MLDELKKVFEIEEVEEKEIPGKVRVVLNRIRDCGKRIIVKKCENCGTEYYAVLNCKHRLCLECARKRAWEYYNLLLPGIMNWRWVSHMVLTLKVNDKNNPKEDIKRIKKCFKKVRRHFKIRLYIGAIEVVPKEDCYYIHLHSLVDKRWISQKELSEYWHKITSDSKIVWVKRVGSKKKALKEVLKYVIKPLKDIRIDDMPVLIEAMYRERFLIVSKFLGGSSLDNIELSEHSRFKECRKCGGNLRFKGIYLIEELEIFDAVPYFDDS